MEQMIAYCGLDCAQCPAYVATQADDREALGRTAAMWREQLNAPEITADSIVCDGCMTDGRLNGYCSICEIRACTLERGMETCASCAEYDGCGKLAAFHEHSPEAKATLNRMRAAL
jgi:predicted nucleic acid binding AN1-type Zn finger protein